METRITTKGGFFASLMVALLFSGLLFTGCQSGVNQTSTAEAISMINAASGARDFEKVQSLADSLERAGSLSKGASNYWKGYAQYQKGDRNLAEYFWQEAIRVTEDSMDPEDLCYYAKSASYLTSQQCRQAKYVASLQTALPVISRLERIQCDTTSDYNNLLILAGCSKAYFDKTDPAATEMLERAYQKHQANIQHKLSKNAYRDAIVGIINVSYIWSYLKEYEQGLFWTSRLGLLIMEYKTVYPDDKEYIDKQWARFKIFEAISLEGQGRHEEAESSYQDYLQTKFSQTKEGLTNASDYLTVAKRWNEAAASYRTIMGYLRKEKNVYSLANIQRYLLKKYHAYQMLNRQDSINLTARQICEVLDSAITNNWRMDASELHAIHVRDMEIVEAEARSARQQQIYTAVIGVFLLLALLTFILFRLRMGKWSAKTKKQE